ncbi:sigma-70 family RNA polymerase sigma factor [Actinomadura sp. KC06]|uniref:sigma-70 family RNA polymerase sigma factor n=1 Tax=Actinomadura sp. KC06 TaxID=2530369 RepID=UPI001046B27A|nr:sigma-70 family RNA polymerase sigma factor [Actinomadura sp. KC06]TDD33898.1 sigma-70 family RNA polymerase sigma factor [Actinomadura sp. KC06]
MDKVSTLQPRFGHSRLGDDEAVVSAARDGDELAFGALAERYRPELRVHCYRMLGSFEEAEDLVQETFLRAWRSRERFSLEGHWSFRAWLYRIATNACLNTLTRTPRRVLPSQLGPAGDPTRPVAPPADQPWLQPFPDHLLENLVSDEMEPETAVLAKETIELAFLAAIQLLPPRQRAVLILRDVLGWPTKEVADLLDSSGASVASALQRARATLMAHLPSRRVEWSPVAEASAEERAVLHRYMEAHQRADIRTLAALLREDAVGTMPPTPTWYRGRASILAALRSSFDPGSEGFIGDLRFIATRANAQPAAACYAKAPGDSRFRAFSLDVLRIDDGQIAEITSFTPVVFPFFELPGEL